MNQLLIKLTNQLNCPESCEIPLNEFISVYNSIIPLNGDLSSLDLIAPIINHNEFNLLNHRMIAILSKITWQYVNSPQILFKYLPIFNQFDFESDLKLSYTDLYFIMNSTNDDDLFIHSTFLGQLNAFLMRYQSIEQNWQGNYNDLQKLIEIAVDEIDIIWLCHFINPSIKNLILEMESNTITQHLTKLFKQNETLSLMDSLKFVLHVLDQGTTINKLNSKVAEKLSRSLDTILKSSKRDLYTCFNSLKSKCSLTITFAFLNYILSNNFMNSFNDNLPVSIINQFKIFNLPPISKSIEFTNTDENYDKLKICQHKVLRLIMAIVEQESKFIGDDYLLIFHEIIISSLLSSLIVTTKLDPTVQNILTDLNHAIFSKVLKSKMSTEVWIVLINNVNDICYNDLRYIHLFINLFESQIKLDPKLTLNDMINSGLLFFIETFQPNHVWGTEFQNESEVEICVEDYKFLYELK